MGYSVAVGERVTELSSARPFSDFLNWVAAQGGALSGRFALILRVQPIEDEYAVSDLPQLITELERAINLKPPADLRFIPRLWLREARRALDSETPLEFV